MTLPIKDIVIENRYRKEYGNIEALASNISSVGLLHPITINQYNNLIDGQRRILAFEKLSKTEIPCFKIDLEEIVLGEFYANTFRKDFIPSEAVRIKKAAEPYEKQKAKERELAGKKASGILPQGKTRDIVAKQVGLGERTLKKAEEIVDAADQNPKYQIYVDEMDSGKPVNKVHKKLTSDIKRQKLIESIPDIELTKNCDLRLGDFREVTKDIPDNSIDLIFTDPPYGIDSIPLYEDLAVLASRVLKPGGSLVTYVGNYLYDLIKSSPPDKILHEWQQSPVEAEYIISKLAPEKIGVVLDPFTGSGTTGIASKKLDRSFIGIEIEKERFTIARANILNELNGDKND